MSDPGYEVVDPDSPLTQGDINRGGISTSEPSIPDLEIG